MAPGFVGRVTVVSWMRPREKRYCNVRRGRRPAVVCCEKVEVRRRGGIWFCESCFFVVETLVRRKRRSGEMCLLGFSVDDGEMTLLSLCFLWVCCVWLFCVKSKECVECQDGLVAAKDAGMIEVIIQTCCLGCISWIAFFFSGVGSRARIHGVEKKISRYGGSEVPPFFEFLSVILRLCNCLGRRGSIRIEYCTGCRWLLRAGWTAQELLTTFETDLKEVTLAPAEKSGTFDIYLDQKLLYSRKAQGRFPELKELKQLVRGELFPGKDLGHSDFHRADAAS